MIEKMCSRGAIELACNLYDEEGNHIMSGDRQAARLAEDALLQQVQENVDKNIASVPQWNDHKAKNVDEVREQMLLAAKNLRNSVAIS